MLLTIIENVSNKPRLYTCPVEIRLEGKKKIGVEIEEGIKYIFIGKRLEWLYTM